MPALMSSKMRARSLGQQFQPAPLASTSSRNVQAGARAAGPRRKKGSKICGRNSARYPPIVVQFADHGVAHVTRPCDEPDAASSLLLPQCCHALRTRFHTIWFNCPRSKMIRRSSGVAPPRRPPACFPREF
jgi:hypothetical protein